jgi:hypothetical protein
LPVTTTYTKNITGPFDNGADSATETWSEVTDFKNATTKISMVGDIDVKKIRKKVDSSMVSPSSSDGNKGSSSKNKGPNKGDDVLERYTRIDKDLSDIADTLSDINKETDRLYGAGRIRSMQNANKALKE